MKELLTELRNKVLYLRNTNELSVKGELILLHKLNALEKQFAISGVSNWVAIESDEQPERVTYVMVKYKDNRKEVAFFDGDGRFYTENDDDITDEILEWHKLP